MLPKQLKIAVLPYFSGAVKAGGTVRAINAKGGSGVLSRKEIDKLTEMVKGIGAKGLGYIRWVEDTPSCSFAKFMTDDEMQSILSLTNAQKGDVVFFIADKKTVTLPVLGALRLEVAKKLDIIPKDKWNLLWITEFPFFELDEETGEYVAMHHPFTAPMDDCIKYLDTAPEKVYAKCFDLVLNGIELSSGSIRITDPALQKGKCLRRSVCLMKKLMKNSVFLLTPSVTAHRRTAVWESVWTGSVCCF